MRCATRYRANQARRHYRALHRAVQSYIDEHPGRYSATIGAQFQGPDDPLLAAATRFIDSLRAILSGYGIPPDERDYAIRMLRCTMHGYAVLKASNAFQWSNDLDESLAWMIRSGATRCRRYIYQRA